MKQKRSAHFTIYQIERGVYFALAFLFLLFFFILPGDDGTVNNILTAALLFILFYHFIFSRIYPPLDLIYTKRMFRPFFTPVKGWKKGEKDQGDRKGALIVLIIYILYISIAAAFTYLDLFVTWNLLMAWTFFLMGLNNIFIYKICLVRLLAMKKTNCCMDCRINGWDDMLIFSVLPLLFAAYQPLNIVNTVLILVIMAFSLIHLFLWEVGLIRNPERFFPGTNAQLCCKNCLKTKCIGKVKGKFR